MSVIIENCSILKMTSEKEIIKNGYIKINNDKIEEIGEGVPQIQNGDEVIDGRGTVAMPGFINTHTHSSMTLLRGYGEGLPLMRWLNEKVWPFEAKLTPDDIYVGAKLAALEMIKSGTTCFLDMYYFEDRICEAIGESGIRGVICTPVIGNDWEARMKRFSSLYSRYNNSFEGRIKTMLAPHAPYTCSKTALNESSKMALSLGCGIHIHIAETEDEINNIKNNYGCTPVQFVEDAGIFDCDGVVAAHCVHMNNDDMNILKKYNVSVAHCPQSNMKLASGISPIWDMINMGINVSLGTDSVSSNNNLDMIEEMQSASYLQKLSTKDATALPAYKCLEMATVSGAKALRMNSDIGTLTEGMKADIILIDIHKPSMVPLYDIYSNIVYSGSGRDVKTVIVNGRVLMKDYKVLVMDEESIMDDISKAVEDILKR